MNAAIQQIEALLRRELPRLSTEYGVDSLALFGSRVRHDERTDSDLDILVSFQRVPGLFRFIQLEDHLSQLVGLKVDLVMRDSLKPKVRERVLDELVPV